jgi:hypothetical protein
VERIQLLTFGSPKELWFMSLETGLIFKKNRDQIDGENLFQPDDRGLYRVLSHSENGKMTLKRIALSEFDEP